MTHGTRGAYTNHACRCAECMSANTDYQAKANRRRRIRAALAAGTLSLDHGNASTYDNWMCRCLMCKEAHATRHRRNTQRRLVQPAFGASGRPYPMDLA